jgi:hypothetical protein
LKVSWSHSCSSSSDLPSVQLGIVQKRCKLFRVMCNFSMKMALFQNFSLYLFWVYVSEAVLTWGLQTLAPVTPTGLWRDTRNLQLLTRFKFV